MDNFVKKRLGIFLLVAVGGLALPIGELIAVAPIPIMWKWYLGAILGAGLIFGEEYVRHLFKISKEEAPRKSNPPPVVIKPATPG